MITVRFVSNGGGWYENNSNTLIVPKPSRLQIFISLDDPADRGDKNTYTGVSTRLNANDKKKKNKKTYKNTTRRRTCRQFTRYGFEMKKKKN